MCGSFERSSWLLKHMIGPFAGCALRNSPFAQAAQQYSKAGMTDKAIARYLVLASMLPQPSEVLAAVDVMLDEDTDAALVAVRQQLAAS